MVNFFKKFDKNKDNRKRFSDLIYSVFKVQEIFTDIQNVNFPDAKPCIYAMWHAHQCCVHGFPDRANCNVLISRSRDGQIIGDVVERWGFKVIHGSKGKKGSVEATLQMINALKSGECCAIMVDGPKGPARVVKDGVVKIAKKAGVPIVPVYWYSPNPTFLKFPSWDSFRIPCFWTKLINIYGEPIHVNPDNDKDEDEEVRLKIQRSLESLEKLAPKAHKEVFRFGLWKK
jgi:hypothetical protein